MTDLVGFLRARLADDAATTVHDSGCDVFQTYDYGCRAGTCDCGWPVRVLAEVDAKRRIVDDLAGYFAEFEPIDYTETDGQPWEVRTARSLALPDRDHPDYQPEWAPAGVPLPTVPVTGQRLDPPTGPG